jgi:hypothetical protein
MYESGLMARPKVFFRALRNRVAEIEVDGRYFIQETREKPDHRELRRTARWYGLPLDVGMSRMECDGLGDSLPWEFAVLADQLMETWERDFSTGGTVLLDPETRWRLSREVAEILARGFATELKASMSRAFRVSRMAK